MGNIHEKCGGILVKWGGRRRRCVHCRCTVTRWPRRRGRKRKRTSAMIARRYLRGESAVSAAIACKRLRSADGVERAVRRSREQFFAHTPWPLVPDAVPLIAVADALMVRTEKRVCVIYLILVRPVAADRAVIMPPFIQDGKESWQGWQDAFAALPHDIRHRIAALVCDGHRGLYSVALRHRWRIQFCIFHMIAKIQGRRSQSAYGRHQEEGTRIMTRVRTILMSARNEEVVTALKELDACRMSTHSPQLRRYLSAFIRRHHLWRTYLEYPELRLPRTSNTAESLVRIIRKMLSRAHGFRTRSSLTRWIDALIKERKSMMCNSSAHQQN